MLKLSICNYVLTRITTLEGGVSHDNTSLMSILTVVKLQYTARKVHNSYIIGSNGAVCLRAVHILEAKNTDFINCSSGFQVCLPRTLCFLPPPRTLCFQHCLLVHNHHQRFMFHPLLVFLIKYWNKTYCNDRGLRLELIVLII